MKLTKNYIFRKRNISAYIFSLLFSFCSIFGYSVSKDIFWLDMFRRGHLIVTVSIFIGSFIGFTAALFIMTRLMQLEYRTKSGFLLFFRKHIFICSFIFICLVWIPVIVIFSPGSLINDAVVQIAQWTGFYDFTSHHPPFSSMILGICYTTGKWLGSENLGYLIYISLQSLCMAAAFAMAVKVCTENWNLIYGIIVLLYFSIFPVWVSFAQAVMKDGLFVAGVMFFILSLLKVIQTKTPSAKNWICLIISAVLMSLLRNNGVYIVIGVIIPGLFIKNRSKRKCLVAALAGAILIVGFYSNVLLPKLGIISGSKAEILSLPFQQTALYVKEHKNEVTDEEKAAIDQILDYDSIGDSYLNWISDPVKSTFKGEEYIKPYLKVWALQFLKHPETYFQAFLNSAAGYLSITGNSAVFGNYFYSDPSDPLGHSYTISGLSDARENIYNTVAKLQNIPVIGIGYQTGLYTWIAMMLVWLAFYRKKYETFILLIPVIINILVCIASPVANCIRYALPTMACIPLCIAFSRKICYGTDADNSPEQKQ